MKDKTQLILKSEKIIKSLFLFALPVMLSNLLKSIHDIIDIYFIGNQNIEPELVKLGISSITLTSPIIQIVQAFALGLLASGTCLMSKAIGSNKEEEAQKLSAQLFLISLFIGIVLTIVIYFFTDSILFLMNMEKGTTLFTYSNLYLKYRSFECPFLFLFYAFIATRQSLGDTVIPVIFNVISILLNICLTWLFVGRWGMNIQGAALATVIANSVITPVFMIVLVKKSTLTFKLGCKLLKPNWKKVKELIRLAVPATLSYALTSLAFMIINRMVVGFSSDVVCAIGIGNRINSILLLPTLSIGTVITTFIGQNIGAKQYKRVDKVLYKAMILTLCLTVVLGMSMYILRDFFVGVFIPKTQNYNTFYLCKTFLGLLILGFPFMGCFQVWVGYFQGIGRTDLGLFLSIIRLWVLRLPLILIMMNKFDLGENAIYYSMILSNGIVSIIGLLMYQKNKRRYQTKQSKTRIQGGLIWQRIT